MSSRIWPGPGIATAKVTVPIRAKDGTVLPEKKPEPERHVPWWPVALGATVAILAVLYWVLLSAALSTVPDPQPPPSPSPQSLSDRIDDAVYSSRDLERDSSLIIGSSTADITAWWHLDTRLDAIAARQAARQQARQDAAQAATQDAHSNVAPPDSSPSGSTAPVSPNSPTSPEAVLAFLPDPWDDVARCESGGSLTAYNSHGWYGLFQFSLGTWQSVGGVGLPTEASAAEQLYRAQKLYARDGASPWPNCGSYLG